MKYPLDRAEDADFVAFKHMKYSGRSRGSSGGPSGDITIYMPENQPGITNRQNWNDTGDQFAGDLGQVRRDLLQGAMNVSDFDIRKAEDRKKAISDITGKLKEYAGNAPELIRQGYIEMLADGVGRSPNQMMSLTKGEIYNPNVEMWYDGPMLRTFQFKFNFMPKSQGEASVVKQIIRTFKMYSSPKENGNKYEIPHVWQVAYGGQCEKFMNKFKPAALTNITVDYNAGLPYHMTFDDGTPVSTSISLSFAECEMITRKDHAQGTGY